MFFLAEAQSLGSIAASDLARYRKGGSLALPDPAPVGPASIYKQGFRYAIRFINRRNQTAGLSNQIFIAPVPIPSAPDKLVSTVMQDSIKLTWNAPARTQMGPAPARIAGYSIYRQKSKVGTHGSPECGPFGGPEFDDRNLSSTRPTTMQ